MPSVKNPNGPSKNRLAARAASAKKGRRQRNELAKNKITKVDAARGARPGILPTSGPRAKISAKKARKLEKKMGYAVKRRMEAEGELEMKDAVDVNAELEKQLNDEVAMEGIN